MEKHISWITHFLNDHFGSVALALLHALHITPSDPALPIPESMVMEAVALIIVIFGALYLKSRPPAAHPVELAAVTDSFPPTPAPGRNEAARRMRAQLPPGAPDELLCANEPDNPAWNGWPGKLLTPMEILGQAFVAAAAWQCVAACDAVQQARCAAANVSLTGPGLQAIAARFVNPNFIKTPTGPPP